MSTRYIWGKYTNEIRYYWDVESGGKEGVNVPYLFGHRAWSSSEDALIGILEQPELNRNTGKATYSGSYRSIRGTSYDIDTEEYEWCIYATYTGDGYDGPTPSLSGSGSGTFTIKPLSRTQGTDDENYKVLRRAWTNTNWKCASSYDGSTGIWVGTKNYSGSTWYDMSIYSAEKGNYPDEFQNHVSSRTSSSYPSFDLASDGYFYYAEDQDVIDPSSVNLPESIRYNSDITISITPSSDAQTNSYGNITYTYQYKFDNGSWTTIETTSETSVELHIPSDKSSIQARVLAQDDIGFTSSTYVLSSTVSIYASDPPSAPSSISIDRTVEGFTTTVTVGEATDTDGTIANYIFERKTQYGDWTQVQSSADLTFIDNPSGSWGTVQYRVCAVDNSGTKGPYITSETYTVLTDVIVIMGPSKKDFGVKIGNFNLSFYVIVAGDTSATGITVTVKIDSQQTFTSTVDTEELVTSTIEVTSLSEGQHTITVTASKGGYTTANETYTFRIEGLTLPEGGNAVQFQDSTGKPVIPISRAEAILFSDGRTLEEVIKSLMS